MSEIVGGSAFFDKTYDEAMTLLIEARNYVAYQQSADMKLIDTDAQLLVSQETMRVTTRMTQVMAWLFGQRAAIEGEISLAEALSESYELGGAGVCLDDSHTDDARLPPAVRSLLDRSRKLYIRVQRLEGMLRAGAA